jgi:hypothetical protein
MWPIIKLKRLKAILETANAEKNEVPSSKLLEKVRDRVLWNSVSVMTMLTLAILFLMTLKLAMLWSIITLVLATFLGFILSKILLSKVSSIFSSTQTKTNINK